jgi:hypothetical protein
MRLAMKIRTAALLCSLSATAACGGSEPAPQPPTAPDIAVATPPPPPAPDPGLAFRKTYQDPGGMWMPSQMSLPEHVENFRQMGVALDAKALSNPLTDPLAGVVWLGGCTASLVSPEGLIVTNHHCVQGALQLNSTPEKNLVENGFLARTQAEEPSAGPAQRVLVVQSYKDVTHEMRDGLEAIKDPVARKDESEKREKQLIAACEKDRPWLRCQVSGFFRGGLYQLIEMLEIKDVRLVYVPARSVGDYGGEVDNWNWPRHTGDWSFYRAYVGKDGKPAEYSPDNVPYHPQHWIHVTTAGLKPSDFVMVTGYPGRTNREETAAEARHDVEWSYPHLTEYYEERYRIAERHLADGGETAIKATTMKQGLQNVLEKFRGIAQGLAKDPELLKQKDDVDQRTRAWAAQPGHEKYKAGIDKLDKLQAEAFRRAPQDFARGNAFGGSRLLSTALGLTRWAEERGKKNEARKPGYQERDMPRAVAGQKQFAKSYDAALDRDTFRLALLRAAKLPESERPWLSLLLEANGKPIDEALVDQRLAAWYGATSLVDEKVRLELLAKGTPAELHASRDPFVRAAQRLWPTFKAMEKRDDAWTGDVMLAAPLYSEAMRQMLGGALAPDANSTLRITYGTVKSLTPDATDLAHGPFTVASQLLAKDTGKDPFNAPPALLAALRSKKFADYGDPALGGELPIDFESDLDITNGNSGSPTLNGKGELVGLAFDGNHEGLASDVVFNGKTTRTISVDSRYMIWTMDAVDHAHRLIREMGLTPKFAE